jgi:hypothetical protein
MLGDDRHSVPNILAFLNAVGLAMTIYRMQFYPEKEFQHFTFSLR